MDASSIMRGPQRRFLDSWKARGRRGATARVTAALMLATLLALPAIAAGAPEAPTARPAASGTDPARARQHGSRADLLYHNYCSVCHGDRGDGRSRARGSLVPPPRDFTSPQSLAELTRDQMIAATAAGKPGTAMVGWSTQLDPREIEDVVDYVIATFMKPRTTAAFSRGRTIYQQTCITCHGEQGQGVMAASNGGKPPRNLATPQARAELTRDSMMGAVTRGRPGTPMNGYENQLSRDDIAAVVDFMRVAFMGASPADASGTSAHRGRATVDPAATPAFPGASRTNQDAGAQGSPGSAPALVRADMRQPFAEGLVGNAARGRKFYDGNCATCHGVKGDAQGPRAYFIRPKPRNFLSDESRASFNRPALFAGISAGRLGSEMPAWSKVLERQEIADVAEYVFQAFIVGASPSAKASGRGIAK